MAKRIQFSINGGALEPDVRYRFAVNDMRIEGDSCFFCGNAIKVGPPVMTPEGTTIWPEHDPIGLMGFFSISGLLAGQGQIRHQLFSDVSDLTRLATVSYQQNSSRQLMVAAIGTLADKTTPCVLELKKDNNSVWTKSLGNPDSDGEVFSDILYNPNMLVIASYRRCNGDEDDYQYEPNHWKFTLHSASRSGYCTDYGSGMIEVAAEYNTYNLTSGHDIGWHNSDASLRLCRLAAGRICMAYGTMESYAYPSVVLFSLPYDLMAADTIMWFANGQGTPPKVHDMVGLPFDNSVAVIASAGTYVEGPEESQLFFPTINTSLLWVPFVQMNGVLKHSVDRWNPYTAITGGYQTTLTDNHIILNLLQDKIALDPTTPPPISCFNNGSAKYVYVGSLYGEKGDYEWNKIYYNSEFNWRIPTYNVNTVVFENTCIKTNILPFSD